MTGGTLFDLSGRPIPRQEASAAEDLRDRDYQKAMERAATWLAVRPLTETQLRRRFESAGFDGATAERAVVRLTELRLVDDFDYAVVIAERGRRKGRGAEAVRAELAAKGCAPEAAERAVRELLGDEEARAKEAAAKMVRKVAARPLREQGRRLHALLVRKGFSPEVAEHAARAVLPPEGWD